MENNEKTKELEDRNPDEYDFDGFDLLIVDPPVIFEEAEKEAEEIYQKIFGRIPGKFQALVDAAQKDSTN